MKYGIELKIDVNKIDKAKLYKGQKGTYLSLTTFVDVDNKDQYDNNGFVKQSGNKDEDLPILGNTKVFWVEGQQQAQQINMQPNATPQGTGSMKDYASDNDAFGESDIPF